MPNQNNRIRAMARESLRQWAPFSERYFWRSPDRPELGCFGTGYNEWGVQTNQKYLGAMAFLGTDPQWDGVRGFSREQALDRALRALRFSLASHQTGDYHCTDGTRWGRTWISPLGIERMMHGVDRLEPRLTDADRARLREVLADEADHQLTVPVVAGLWAREGRNKPESNIWNGAICARAALYCPDHPHCPQWMERAHLYFLNSISVPADATDETVIAGRPLKDWHVGANFFPHYALDHHAYLNVGYMVICLSNIAMLHYTFALRGKEAPRTLYHHARDLWRLVRRLVFADGRLLRIGGDTRIRYCYCQDYLLPTLVFAADHWQDPHALALLEGAVELVRREQALSEDGRFLCRRLAALERQSPYYFTRLESDKAVVLSMVLDWMERGRIEIPPASEDFETSVQGGWEEQEHGVVFHRSPTRVASWSWRAAELPQGLCLPPKDGDLAEWKENLAGGLHFLGEQGRRELRGYTIHSFEGGFLTMGSVTDGAKVQIPEGWQGKDSAIHHIVFAALPDGHSVVRMERAVLAPRRAYLVGWEGMKLEVPNDCLFKNPRRYEHVGGTLSLTPHEGEPQVIALRSPWVNVNGVIGLIGIYGAEKTWTILRRGARIGGSGSGIGNILTDTLCFGLQTTPCDIYGPAIVLDNACLILSSITATQTRALAESGQARPIPLRAAAPGENPADLRAVLVRGQDHRDYLLAANFGPETLTAVLGVAGGPWRDAVTGEILPADDLRLPLPSQQSRLLSRTAS